MDNLIKAGKINRKKINSLTEIIIQFHNHAPTSKKISNFAQPRIMKRKFNENFNTISRLEKIDPIFEFKLNSFLENNKDIFYQCIKESKIRDIHGDLYLKNIFIMNNKFYLYDRIEFNDTLRYADVIEDISHLALDLDFHKKTVLSKYLIKEYIQKSHNNTTRKLSYFMMCYKACVRAKVSFFRAQEVDTKNKKIVHVAEAKKHLKLAKKYIKFF